MRKFSTFPGAARAIRELSSVVESNQRAIQTIPNPQVFAGIGSPVGVLIATGPAIYYDRTTPTAPITWIKVTSTTSNNDWILPIVESTRAGATVPGVEFVVPTSSRVLSTLVDPSIALNQDIGAGDFTWWVQLSVPASLSGNAAIGSLGPNNFNALPASDNAVALLQQNGDIQLVLGNTTNNTRYGLGLSGRTEQIVDITITRTGGSLAVYIDGTLITPTSTNTGAGCPAGTTFNTTFAMIGGAHSSGNPNAFAGIVYRFVTYNRRLTATEVASLVRFGVDISDQWGSKAPRYSSDFSVNTNGWGAANGTAAGNIDGIGGEDNNLRYTIGSGANVADGASRPSTVIVGKRYQLSFRYFIPSGQQQITTLRAFVGLAQVVSGLNAGNTWTQVTASGIATVDTLIRVNQNFVGTGNGTDVFYVRDVSVTQLGAFLDLSFVDIYGFQAPDRSDNELDGTLIGDAAFTLPGTKSGQARWTCGANLGTLLLGQRAIPPGAAIRTVFVENIDVAGTPTFSLGTTSGGTQIINAVTIGAAGTITQIAPSVIFSSTGNLWASWSAAGDVRVTVLYDRI